MEHYSCIFRFADIEVDESNFSVIKAGEPLPLEPKVFKVLQLLLHHPGRVVTKDELLDAVWSDTSVSESSLTRSVATLRRLLGDDIREPRFIATIPTVGYRFLCSVEVSENGHVPARAHEQRAESPAEQPSKFELPATPTKRWKRRLYWLIAGVVGATAALLGVLWLSSPAVPVVEGISQITDDGYPKLLTAVISDGSRIYFNEIRDGTQVLAQVATTGGESGLVPQSIPGPYLAAYGADPSRLLLLGSEFPNPALWLLPLPAGEPHKLADLTGTDATLSSNGDIAFVQRGDLYLAKGDGSDPRKLFSFPKPVDNPVTSPDGKKIRVSLSRDLLTREIWEINSDGSNPHPTLKDSQNRFDAGRGRWTADGKYYVFESKR